MIMRLRLGHVMILSKQAETWVFPAFTKEQDSNCSFSFSAQTCIMMIFFVVKVVSFALKHGLLNFVPDINDVESINRFTYACQVEKVFLIYMGSLTWQGWPFKYLMLLQRSLYVLV